METKTTRDVKKRTQIVTANTVDDAQKICKWATIFQRTEDWKITNKWICSTYER